MMKTIKIMIVVVLLLAAAWLTPLLLKHPGLIQIELLGYQIQMTAIAAGLIIGTLFLLIWLSYALIKAPKKALKHINAQSGRKKFAKGLLLLSEGKWPQAEKLLLQSVKQNPAPELSYMAAARAAVSQNKLEQAEAHLDAAEQCIDNPLTVDLTRCELWLKTGQADKAQALLDLILKTYPNNPRAVHLQTQVAQQLGQWDQLQQCLPKAEKLRLISPDQARLLKQKTTQSLLDEAESESKLLSVWQTIDKTQRPFFNHSFCHNALRVGAYQALTDHIEKSQKLQWDDGLVGFWSSLPHNLNHRLKVAEKWLTKQPGNPHVLFCNAQLQMAKKHWDQAESLLLKAQAIQPNPLNNQEIDQLLGQVYQEMQQPEKALAHYQKAHKNTGLQVIDQNHPTH